MATELKLHLAMDGAAEVAQELGQASQAIGKSTDTWQQNMRGVSAAMRDTAAAGTELSQSAQRIMDRYDPLGTKLRALTSDMATLRREMGDSSADGAIKAFQGLEGEIEKTKALMAQAGVAGADGFEEAAKAADKSAFATAGARRELLVLGHEAISGNFSRMPGSFMVLAEKMDLTSALLSPMALGFTALAVVAVTLAAAYYQGAHEVSEFNKQMALTGGYAGITKGKFNDMAASIAASTNTGIGTAKQVMQGLISTGRIAGDAFDSVAATAVNFASRTGESSDKVVKDFAKLSDGVVAWATQHDKQYHFLTAAQYEHIAALEAEGETSLAMVATMSALDQHLAANQENIGYVGKAWRLAKEDASGYWDIIKGIGAGQTTDDKATAAAQKALAAQVAYDKAKAQQNAFGGKGADKDYLDSLKKAADDAKASYDALNAARTNDSAAAKAKAQADQVQDAGKKAIEEHNKLIASIRTRQQVEDDAVADYEKGQAAIRAAGNATVDNAAQHADVLKGIHDKLNPDRKETKSAYDAIAASIDAANQKALIELSTGEKISAADQLRISIEKQIDAAMRAGTLTLGERNAALDKLKEALANTTAASAFMQWQKDEAKAVADAQKSYDALIATVMKAAKSRDDGLDSAIAKQRLHNDEIGKTKAQIEDVKAAQEQADISALQGEADRLTAMLAQNDALTAYGDILGLLTPKQVEMSKITLAALNEEIEKRRTLANLLSTGAIREADAQAAKDAAESWKKGWTATDNFARGIFDTWGVQGGNWAQKLGDQVKKALATAFYDYIVRPIVLQIYASVMGSGGTAGAAVLSAMGGNGNAASSVSGLSSLYTMGSKGYSYVSSLFGGSGATAAGGTVDAAVTQATISGGSTTNAALYSNAGYGAGEAGTSSFAGIPVVGWIMMGMMASGAAYDQGFRAGNNGGIGYTVSDGGQLGPNGQISGIDKILQGLGIDGKTAAILSGSALGQQAMYTVLGGYQVSPAGQFLTGTVGGSGTSLQTRTDYTQDHRGPLGIGSYTTHNSDYSAADPGAVSYIDQAVKVVQASVKVFASTLGLSADAVDGFSRSIEVSIGGLDAAGQKAAVDKAITGFMNDMVTSLYGAQISNLAISGEDSSTTLARVATEFLNVNDALNLFGVNLLKVGIDGATAADSLVKMMGGLQAFQTQTADFARNYLTTDQQRAASFNSISSTLQAGGVNVSADQLSKMSRADVAAYVQTLDLTTTAGQKAYAAVMSVEAAFASLTPSLDAVSQAAAQAAAQNAQLIQSALKTYGTAQEQKDFAIAQIQSGLSAGGVNLTADQIGNATRADARNLYNYYANQHTAAGDAAAHAILTQADAFTALTASANDATSAIGGGGGGGGATGALDSLASAAKTAADSIAQEVARINGLVAGPGDVGYAQAQANFAVATAQARSGYTNAAACAPWLSQAMLTLAEANTSTLLELKMIQAQTAASLSTTNSMLGTQYGFSVPQYAVGTNSVPQDMLALIHQGETIIPDGFDPRQFMNEMGASGTSAAFVQAMNAFAAAMASVATNTKDGADAAINLYRLFQFCSPTGQSIQMTAVTP